MSREARKKTRKRRVSQERTSARANEVEARARWLPPVLTDEDHARLRRRFSAFQGRGHTLRFVFQGPVVEASTPDQLSAAMRSLGTR